MPAGPGDQPSSFEEGFQLGAGMLVAFFAAAAMPFERILSGFGGAGFAREELGVHQIGGDVVGVTLEKEREMRVGSCGVTAVHTLHGESIAGEGVFGLRGTNSSSIWRRVFFCSLIGSSRIIRVRE